MTATYPLPGSVVGTVHSARSLAAARKLSPGAVDFIELRVDAFAALPDADRELARLESAAGELAAPLIVTARHPREGGAGSLSLLRRRELLLRFMGHSAMIDIELRSAVQLAVVANRAAADGVGIILSYHDFRTTPPLATLKKRAARALNAGCTVFKVAVMAETAQSLTVLMRFLTETPGFTLSAAGPGAVRPGLAIMGMGAFGKVSRIALGGAGSALNYGYLDSPQVPGQWPAELLKQRLAELRGG